MSNRPFIAVVITVLVLAVAGGAILATEPVRIAVAERALYVAAAEVAQEVVQLD